MRRIVMCKELLCSALSVVVLAMSMGHFGSQSRAELIGYWKFDESYGATATDSAGGDNDGTLSGDVRWQPEAGRSQGTLLFSSQDTRARVEIPTVGMSASEGTMMAWGNLAEPYPTNRVDASYFFGHTTQPSYANRIQLYMDGNNTILDLGLGDSHTMRTNIVELQTEIWFHVALTWDSGRYFVYLDGEEIAAGSYTGLTALHNFMDIGNDGNPNSQGTEAFAGLLDEVRLYDHALTADEVRTAMNSAASPQAWGSSPADGALHPETWVTLSWMAGDSAVSHDVYFGDNFDDVNNSTGGTFVGNWSSNELLVGLPGCPYPDGLVPGTTYYWRIDEVEADGVTIYKGSVWRFSVLSDKANVVVIPKDGNWASSINALQPGDIGQLEAARYLGGKTITVSGTLDKPVIIRGASHLESIFDGESGNCALRLDNCSNVIIENITVTNPSPIGIDGRENYSSVARNQLPKRDPGYSTLAEGIIIRGGGSGITIRRSCFVDIATRGMLVGEGVDDLTVEHNIFLRVSDDTAGGDVEVGGSATRMTVRENLMAGNVDGIITDGAGAGHIFERNVIIFHRWEDGIDIKRTWKRKDEDLWTIVRNNVFYSRLNRYSSISIQFGSDYVNVLGNVFHGTGACETILIRGRNGSEGIVGNVENHEIIGNWFDFKPGYNDSGNAFRIHQYTADPSDISNVYILHNVFTGGHRLGGITYGRNLNIYNNIFESTTFGSVTADVAAGTNLYYNTTIWRIDTNPIFGEPVYTENPVGPLAEGSPGKGRATVLRGHDLGNDVGLPQSTENLVKLEISILHSLGEHFIHEEIKEAMEEGGVTYDDDGDRLFDLWEKYYFGGPTACDPNADPDNDGIANLEEYANGTDPLDPNSVP
jgi:hypothetical protein